MITSLLACNSISVSSLLLSIASHFVSVSEVLLLSNNKRLLTLLWFGRPVESVTDKKKKAQYQNDETDDIFSAYDKKSKRLLIVYYTLKKKKKQFLHKQ